MKNKNISIFVLFLICILSLLSSAAVEFVDVTAGSGIDFRHINGAEGAYHLPETLGSGGAFLDVDNDGYLDVYLVNSGYWDTSASAKQVSSALYQNNSDGTFTDITVTAGVGNRGSSG
ncbi:MAG: VCBS repeat-containing protein, partial [Candidatus Poribacteria bacterium]|nr:VCBS repeat-containing protein [Candidatus Poribacteria bacterium]